MNYNPHEKTLAEIRRYFKQNATRFPGVLEGLEQFIANPSLSTARIMMGKYFKLHQKDDVESLRIATSTFADKRLVKAIVESVLDDEVALAQISHRSYPHPIGFDKLVLYDDKETGFKFRLHIYWRGNQRAAMERMHLHRFEMASAIVTGELTNHTWRVTKYIPEEHSILPAMEIADHASEASETMYAYSGYWRDTNGVLHKQILGECEMQRGSSDTFVSGHSYAQILSDGHYVETNAETGQSNGDVCSTIYVHSGGLADEGGRKIPILFEQFRLATNDQVIDTIPAITPETLRNSLIKYRDFLQESLDFYEWVYDPKHGRDLSVGMIAGYFLSESKTDPHIITKWISQEKECKEILDACSQTLAKLVHGEMALSDISDDDRNKRYYAILLEKSENHPGGKDAWLSRNGDLVKEMWRYCGALKGEKPNITVLKPVWEAVVGRKLPGGAHYGHIAAMIEAVYEANDVAMRYFKGEVVTEFKKDGSPTSNADKDIEALIRTKLAQHYPTYHFTGEENGDDTNASPVDGDHRWLVDPIDGTRNFLRGRDEFTISIACQTFKDGQWVTTDGVVSVPVSGKIFWAEKGHGAYMIERTDSEQKLEPCDHHGMSLAGTLVDVSLRGFGADGEGKIITSLHNNGVTYRNTGSVALMLAMVAGKGSDGAIITANDYDIEGAKLVAQEAGATISNFSFTRNGKNFEATIAGESPTIHYGLRRIVESVASDFQLDKTAPRP